MRKSVKFGLLSVALMLCIVLGVKGYVLQVASGTWAGQSGLGQSRSGASAVLLQDGRILVTGGDGAAGTLASAELIGTDGTSSAAATMSMARSRHVSALLANGTVLAAGGTTIGGGATNTAEIYDPVSNSWTTLAGGMVEARSNATATVLLDGRVLIAGGDRSGVASSTIEIFDPVALTFSFAGALASPRTDHAMARLSDGRVFIAGGSNGNAELNTTDIYDPVTGSVNAGPALSALRMGHSATTMLDGRVLIAGGNNGTADLASAEIFDPVVGTMTAVASSLSTARQGHLAFLLPNNNTVLIVGGTSAGVPLASAEVFTPWLGTFAPTGSLTAARSNSAGSPMKQDGLLLVAGGQDASGVALGNTDLFGFATVKTDQADYSPGQIVTITGSGWQPGETVTLTLVESPFFDTHGPFTTIADSNGSILNSSFVVDSHDIGIHFSLTAAGAVSQAQTMFSDGNAGNGDGTMTVSPSSVIVSSTGNSLVFTFSTANGKDFNAGSQASILVPAGWTAPTSSNVVVAKNSCTAASLSTITGTGPWTVPINMTCAGGSSFSATYSPVTAPSTTGGNTFTTQTKQNGGTLTTIGTSPVVTVNNPVPTTTSIAPSTKNAGDAAFTLTVNGTNFVPGSTVNFNGTSRTTTFVSSTQLTASITAADIATGGTFNITVTNLTPGGGTSNAQILTVNNLVPTTTSIAPTTKNVGDVAFTLSVNGTNFVSTSVVNFNGSARTTTFGSATQLTAAIPASDLTTGGTFNITVTNPAPGGGTSNAQTLTVNNNGPTTTSISPASATVGSGAFTLTVNGTNFVSNSVVNFAGSPRTTTFVSNIKVTAAIPASDLTTAGTFNITVTNPAPGGGTSNSQVFSVNNSLPTTTTISPASKNVGDATFTLTVNGTNFVSGAVVSVSGSPRTTNFVSPTQVTAAIPATDLTSAGTFNITVTNPAPGGGTSNAQALTVNNLVPTTTSIAPTSKNVGDTAFTLTVNGTNFISTSLVNFNGSVRTTTFVSATQLTASITAADVSAAGTPSITVTNPAPGGGTSNAQTLTVSNPAPTTTSISPATKSSGDAAFTLTVNGTNFISASVVDFNGAARTTTFGSGTQLTAAITAADVANAGTFNITVVNAAPGGGTSNAQSLTVNPKLVITSNAFAILTGTCSSQITAQTRNADNSGANQASARTLTLSSNSAGGKFFSDAGCTTQVNSVTIGVGSSTANFFYSDTSIGIPVITVASTGLTSATQTETETGLRFSNTALSVSVGQCSSALTLQSANTAGGNPTSLTQATTISLTSSPSGGKFYSDTTCTTQITTTSIGPAIDGGHDSPNFFYKDTTAGSPVITALAGTASATQMESVTKNTPVFTVPASQSITFGTASINLSGTLAAGTSIPSGQNVSITINSVVTNATIGATGAFSATVNTSAIPASTTTYAITYSYAGDANFNAATNNATTLTVTKASSTAAVASSPNPSNVGQLVTFSATVTASGGASGIPTGTVTFLDGTTTLGSGPLNASGVATFNTSSLAAGSHSITAAYGGDTNFASSTSTAVSQTVNNPATTTMVISSLNPSTFGASVTFTATVSSVSGTPSGSVTFYDGGACVLPGTLLSGPTALVSGQAGFSTSALSAGSHPILACYAPTGVYLASFGSVTQVVSQAQATLAFDNLTFGYDGTPKPVTVTTNPANLTGVTILYNGGASAPTNAGTTPVSASLTNANYTATTITGNETIQAAPVVITISDPMPTYDANPHMATISVVPNVSVAVTYNGLATAPTAAGTYSVVVTTMDANYAGSANGTLTIKQAQPTVTWANPADISFGTALSPTQLNATASVPGTFTYTPAASTVLQAGAGQTLSVDFTPNDAVDYASVLGTKVQINVTAASLYVVSSDGSRAFGQGNPTFTPTFIGLTDGDTSNTVGTVTCLSAAGTTSAPGTYAATCSGVSSPNYTVKYIAGTLSVSNPLNAITQIKGASPNSETLPIGASDVLTATGQFANASTRALSVAGGTSFGKTGLTTPVFGAAMAEAGGVLYAIGGSDGTSILGTIQAYDPATGSWTLLPNNITLATPRTNAAVASAAGKIYVIGGNDATNNVLSSVEVLDTTGANPTVSPFAGSLSAGRSAAGAAVFNQKLYVIGGSNGASPALSSIDIFDLVTGNPTPSSADAGATLSQASAAVLTRSNISKLYVAGVSGSSVVLISFDGTNWNSPVTTSLDPTQGVGITSFGGPLYLVNGASMWSYDGTAFVQKNSLGNAHNGTQPVTIGSLIYAASVGSGSASSNLDAFAPDEVKWSSADATKATVDQSGNITAVAITSPTVAITATSLSDPTISAQFQLTIIKKTQTIQFGALSPKTYGDADFNISATSVDSASQVTGLLVGFTAGSTDGCTVGASILTAGVSTATVHITGAGNCTITAAQPGDDTTWQAATSVPQTFAIAKADSSTVISCPASVTFDGTPQTPCTALVTGVGGLSQAVTVSYTNNTYAGTANATAAYPGDANHNASNDAKTFTINKASSSTAITCPVSVTFDGTPQTPCTALVTGVGGLSQAVTVSYTNNTYAGTANATAAYSGDANHNGSNDAKAFTINKASSSTTITCPVSVNFDGTPQTPCTALVTGAGSLSQAVTVTYNNNIYAGTATANATYAGDANHNGSNDTKTFVINKANSSTLITCPAMVTYNGMAQTPCSVAVTGIGGLSLTPPAAYTNNVTAGTATASYTFAGDTNHNGSNDTKMFTIAPAPLLITASSGSMVYGGPAFPVTPSYAGFVNLEGPGNLTTQPTCGTAAANTLSPVGTYVSSCVGASAANYTITYMNGVVTITPAGSTTTVSSSLPTSSNWGQVVIFTATVTPQFSGTPTGSVSFYNAPSGATCQSLAAANAATLDVEPLTTVGSSQQVSTSNAWLPVGTDTVLACYSGDSNFISSNGTVSQTVIAAPIAKLDPASLSFGNQQGGTISGPQTVNISNPNGTAPLLISSIKLSGTNPTYFTESDSCSSVAVGASCSITVRFAPPANTTGVATANVIVTDNDENIPGSMQTSLLTGAGTSSINSVGSLSTYGIFATANGCSSINMSGNALVDSINSGANNNNGNVGTNGNATLSGNPVINGAVYSPIGGTGNCSSKSLTGLSLSGKAQAIGGPQALSKPLVYPAPPAPNPAPPTTSQNISGSCGTVAGCTGGGTKIVFLAPGQYGNLSISGGTTAHFNGTGGAYNFNSLTLSGNSTLVVDSASGPVVVNLAGKSVTGGNAVLDLTGGVMSNATGQASNLQFYYAGSQPVKLSGNAASYAVVYAPNAPINLSGGSHFYGAITGSTVNNSGGTAIHYDAGLPNIPTGDYIWFNSAALNVQGLPSSGSTKVYVTNASISFPSTSGQCTGTYLAGQCALPVPNAVVTFSSTATTASTTWDAVNSRWTTLVPTNGSTTVQPHSFIDGLAYMVPASFPAGIQNVTWSAAFSTSTPNISFSWQWGAAIYSSFNNSYPSLGVNPVDSTDPAGTPESYKGSLVFGATGPGYIGLYTGAAGVVPTIAEASVAPSSLDFTNGGTVGQSVGITSAPLQAVLTNNMSGSLTISNVQLTGTDPGDFALLTTGANSCLPLSALPVPGSLPSGASCTLYVTFTPSAIGKRTAKIVVNDNANNTPQTVFLKGAGQ